MSEGGAVMGNQGSASNVTSHYDGFLFATIRVESGGLRLSVLSALARMNVDPWEEAARLTALPAPEAERALVSILDRVPDKQQTSAETGILAARLVALLPKADATAHAKASKGPGRHALRNRYWLALLFFAIAMWYLSAHQLATTTSAEDPTSVVNAIPPTQGSTTMPEPSAVNSPPDFGTVRSPTDRPPE